MVVKDNNEITVKVISSKEKLIAVLKQKGFTSGRIFTLDDYYFIPNELDVENLTTREIISKCIIIRNIFDDNVYKKKITYKIKKFDNNGDILIEIETEPNSDFDTIDKLKKVIINLEIPIENNEFFIKKAEIELNKILSR